MAIAEEHSSKVQELLGSWRRDIPLLSRVVGLGEWRKLPRGVPPVEAPSTWRFITFVCYKAAPDVDIADTKLILVKFSWGLNHRIPQQPNFCGVRTPTGSAPMVITVFRHPQSTLKESEVASLAPSQILSDVAYNSVKYRSMTSDHSMQRGIYHLPMTNTTVVVFCSKIAINHQ